MKRQNMVVDTVAYSTLIVPQSRVPTDLCACPALRSDAVERTTSHLGKCLAGIGMLLVI